MDDAEWVGVDSGQLPPTSQSHEWRRFLTEDAVKLIRVSDDDPNYQLLLELPSEEA
jgi:hypothetical protein